MTAEKEDTVKICYIVGAAKTELPPLTLHEGDFLIAADGGLAACRAAGLKPDAVLGDFDSLGYVPPEADMVFPREKDNTDMELACHRGMAAGYRFFVLLGGLYGRLDLEFSNYQILRQLAGAGCRGLLCGGGVCVTAIAAKGRPASLRFPAGRHGRVSVFAPGGASGVTERGLQYSLEKAELPPYSALGVSNELTGEAAEISCEAGDLILFWEGEAEDAKFVFDEETGFDKGRPV